MAYYYASLNKSFLWHPYAKIDMDSNNETATIYVNDFFTQLLPGTSARFGYKLTHNFIGFDGSRMTQFGERYLKIALLCLSNFPLDLSSSNSSYFDANPIKLMFSLDVDCDQLVQLVKQKHPNLKKIKASPSPADAISYSFPANSEIISTLFKYGIDVQTQDDSLDARVTNKISIV